MKTMTYKCYTGSIEWSETDKCFFGEVQHIGDLVSYEGNTEDELKKNFEISIDEYIELCERVKEKRKLNIK